MRIFTNTAAAVGSWPEAMLKVGMANADDSEAGRVRSARILSVSRTGVLLQVRVPLVGGERVRIHLGQGEAVLAHVRWADQNMAGCEFDSPLARSRLSAVLLQSVSSTEKTAPTHPAGIGHSDMDAGNNAIGDMIARRRKAFGLTQSELGDAVNVSTTTVCKWERGQAKPRKGAIERLSAILDKDLSLAADTLTGPRQQDAAFASLVQEFKGTVAALLGIDEGDVSVQISA